MRFVAVTVAAVALVACGKHREHIGAAAPDAVTITVTTDASGTAPRDIAASITTPLEHALGQLPNLKRLSSRSGRGLSTILAEFPAGTDGYEASSAVMNAAQGVSTMLPETLAARPAISRGSRAGAVMRIILASQELPLLEVGRVARELVAQRLERVAGVGRVELCGAPEDEVKVTVDPVALAATGKTIDDIRAEVEAARGSYDELPLVRAVAKVANTAAKPTCTAFSRQTPVVAVTVTPQAGANPVDVRERLEATIPAITASVPANVHLHVWPRTRPFAFEIRLPAEPARTIEHLRDAAKELEFTDILEQAGLHDPRIADVRIVAETHPDTLEQRALESFDHNHLTVLDRHDHVVGFRGVDPAALRKQIEALEALIVNAKQLSIVEEYGREGPVQTLKVDRDMAARFGVSTRDIDRKLQLLGDGAWITSTYTQLDQKRVTLAIAGELPQVLDQLMVRTANDGSMPLSAFVSVLETSEPDQIIHENQMTWMGARIAGPLDALDTVLAKLPIPAGIERDVREPE